MDGADSLASVINRFTSTRFSTHITITDGTCLHGPIRYGEDGQMLTSGWQKQENHKAVRELFCGIIYNKGETLPKEIS